MDPTRQWAQIFTTYFSPEVSVKYASAFVQQALLPETRFHISTEDLEELGILVGHRRTLKFILREHQRRATFSSPLSSSSVLLFSPVQREQGTESEGGGVPRPGTAGEDAAAAFVGVSQNEIGCRWVRMRNNKEIQQNFPALGFDPTFLRCFKDRKQMSIFLSREEKGGGWSAAIVLRVPEARDMFEVGNTLASLTTRLVILAKMNGALGTVLTYHRRDIDDLTALADRWSPLSEAYDGSLARASPADLMIEVLKIAAREFSLAIDYLKAAANDAEVEKDLATSVTKLTFLQRQFGVLSLCLLGALEVLQQLSENDFAKEQGLDVSEVTQKLSLCHTVAEEAHDNATSSVELKIAVDGFRSGENMKFFTAMAFVLQPVGAITGWYGMNFDNMPELHYTNSYFAVIGIVLGIVVLISIGLFLKS